MVIRDNICKSLKQCLAIKTVHQGWIVLLQIGFKTGIEIEEEWKNTYIHKERAHHAQVSKD